MSRAAVPPLDAAALRSGQLLYSGRNADVFRLEVEGCSLIFKVLRGPHPSPEELARFEREEHLTRGLAGDHVATLLGRTEIDGLSALVLEDAGDSLDRSFAARRPVVEEALDLAIQLAQALGHVHAAHVIHKDICPGNVVVSSAGVLRLIDFGISAQVSREKPSLVRPSLVEGTLAYIAPEQTGRMNAYVDSRADLYGFGATLYWLLTGRPPFEHEDAPALVHAHLATTPIPPHQIEPQVPEALSAVVMKLLEKEAHRRYRTAYGVQADLEKCRQQLQGSGAVVPFALGGSDHSARLDVPDILYGRGDATNALLAGYRRVEGGPVEFLLVTGPSGIGKTSFVKQIHVPLSEGRGRFLAGKIDQYQRGVPHAPLAAAMGQLVRSLLAESDGELARWRRILAEAVGPHAQALIDLAPELERVIGAQPPLAEIGGREHELRLHRAFCNLIAAVCAQGGPLVLFFDDLQWVDAATLALIEALVTSEKIRNLLVLGAYRDNEVGATHLLQHGLDRLQAGGAALTTLRLGPLAPPHVESLLRDTLGEDAPELAELAELCHRKTAGNPYFLRSFLKLLHDEGVLVRNAEGAWSWSLLAIRQQVATDNVVTLARGRLMGLPRPTRAAVRTAAFLGTTFELETLACALERTPQEVLRDLREAQSAEIVDQLQQTYSHQDGAEPLLHATYQFTHDRVQQAAHELATPEEAARLHREIGALLLRTLEPEQWELRVVEIVDHLNAGGPPPPERRDEFAALNELAGRRARVMAAFAKSLHYFQRARALLGPQLWTQDYERALRLHNDGVEVALLAPELAVMAEWRQAVLEHAKSPLDAVQVQEAQIRLLSAQLDLEACIQLGVDVLNSLGHGVARHPSPARLGWLASKAALAVWGKDDEALVAMPALTHPDLLAVTRITALIAKDTYRAAPRLYLALAFRNVEITATVGTSAGSGIAYAAYALALCAMGLTEQGCRFAALGIRLCERAPETTWIATLAYTVTYGWRSDFGPETDFTLDQYHRSLDQGERGGAAFLAAVWTMMSFHQGRPLGGLLRTGQLLQQDIGSGSGLETPHMLLIYLQAAHTLQEASPDPWRMQGPWLDEDTATEAQMNQTDAGVFHIAKLALGAIFGRWGEARGHIAGFDACREGLLGGLMTHWGDFWAALVLLADAQHATRRARARAIALARRRRRALAKAAAVQASNFGAELQLVDAEIARASGRHQAAADHYEAAIMDARACERLDLCALANERMAALQRSRGNAQLADGFLREARHAYERWGASAKVAQLDEDNPLLRVVPYAKGTTTKGSRTIEQLDVLILLKATQAIAQETEVERLVERLGRLTLEVSGADRSLVLIKRDDELWVSGEATADHSPWTPRSVELDAYAEAPGSLIWYVARSGAHVLAREGLADPWFASDLYLQRSEARAAMCVPIHLHGRTQAIAYLESSKSADMFSEQWLEVLQVLLAQAAISIENAQLLLRLEERVARRTEQLRVANEALEAEVLQREQLIGTVGHELRTPLACVRMVSRLLRDGVAAADQVFLDDLDEVVSELDLLIIEVMQLGSLSSGDLVPKNATLGTDELWAATIQACSGLESEVEVEVVETPGLTLRCNRRLLKAALVNLVSNAIRYATGQVRVEAVATDGAVRLVVEDDGPGVPKTKRSAILRPASRGDLGRRRDVKGAGLGLAIAQRIARGHGGTVLVEEGQVLSGARMTIIVPLDAHLTSRIHPPRDGRGAAGGAASLPGVDRDCAGQELVRPWAACGGAG